MTRKDYQLIADAIRARKDYTFTSAAEARYLTIKDLTVALALDNPRFDAARFLAACGVES